MLISLSLCWFSSVYAFDIDAHDAAGQTTASAMDQKAMKQVKRLLGGKDPGDVAGWGHSADDTYPGLEKLHFQVHDDSAAPFCGPVESRVTKCEDNICLLAAIKHFYGKILKDEGRTIEYPNIDYSKVAPGITFTDADSVKMLINLLGDLHQPMHVGYAGDDMGRKVQVKFKDKTMSLYDVWDKGISETVRTEEANFWLGGWTHVGRIRDEFEKDKEGWTKEGAFKMFEKWLEESIKFACDVAYANPAKPGSKLAGPNAEAGPIDLSGQSYMEWRSRFLRQILLAGERTAIVLNDILDASGADKLSEKTGVKTKADKAEEDEKEEWEKEFKERKKNDPTYTVGSSRTSMQNGLTNLGILCVVAPIFFVVATYGLNPATYAYMWKNLGNKEHSASGPAKRFE